VKFFKLVRLSGVHFWKADGMDHAMVLAFTSLLGLVPVLGLLLSLFSASTWFEDLSERLVTALVHWLTPSAMPVVETYLNTFSEKATSLTGISAWLMALTSLLLLAKIDQKINHFWTHKHPRRWWVSLLHYFGVSVAGPLVLALALTLQSWLVASGLAKLSPILAQWLPASLYLLGLMLLYRYVPVMKVTWKEAFYGALLVAVLLEGLQYGFGVYVSVFGTYNLIYGAFAAVPFFLLWLYGLWLVILFGAVWVRTLGRLRRRREERVER
jgi:membrane protein